MGWRQCGSTRSGGKGHGPRKRRERTAVDPTCVLPAGGGGTTGKGAGWDQRWWARGGTGSGRGLLPRPEPERPRRRATDACQPGDRGQSTKRERERERERADYTQRERDGKRSTPPRERGCQSKGGRHACWTPGVPGCSAEGGAHGLLAGVHPDVPREVGPEPEAGVAAGMAARVTRPWFAPALFAVHVVRDGLGIGRSNSPGRDRLADTRRPGCHPGHPGPRRRWGRSDADVEVIGAGYWRGLREREPRHPGRRRLVRPLVLRQLLRRRPQGENRHDAPFN